MTESARAIATRLSIKKYFPMGSVMSKGKNNPITLHSVNDDLFARVWALIAETMCVTGESVVGRVRGRSKEFLWY